jgi:hypothetical protein
MKLSDGIEQYVVGKHASGLAFERGESNLTAFFRQVGDVDLGQVKTQQVLTYLNGSENGAYYVAPQVPNSIPFLRFLVFPRSDARAAHAPGQSKGAPNLRSVCLYPSAAAGLL